LQSLKERLLHRNKYTLKQSWIFVISGSVTLCHLNCNKHTIIRIHLISRQITKQSTIKHRCRCSGTTQCIIGHFNSATIFTANLFIGAEHPEYSTNHLDDSNNKKAQLTLTNPRDSNGCKNCSNSTCFVSFHRIPFPQISNYQCI